MRLSDTSAGTGRAAMKSVRWKNEDKAEWSWGRTEQLLPLPFPSIQGIPGQPWVDVALFFSKKKKINPTLK